MSATESFAIVQAAFAKAHPAHHRLQSLPDRLKPLDISNALCHDGINTRVRVECPAEDGVGDIAIIIFKAHQGGTQNRDFSVRAGHPLFLNNEGKLVERAPGKGDELLTVPGINPDNAPEIMTYAIEKLMAHVGPAGSYAIIRALEKARQFEAEAAATAQAAAIAPAAKAVKTRRAATSAIDARIGHTRAAVKKSPAKRPA